MTYQKRLANKITGANSRPAFAVRESRASAARFGCRASRALSRRGGCRSVRSLDEIAMSLIPTSRHGWILSLLRPLFTACAFILAATLVWGSVFDGIYWRYARAPLVYELLPWLAIALLSVCIVGELLEKAAHRRFRVVASIIGIVAMITALVAPILEPAYS